MAKNGATLAISIMLTILVRICSSIDKFDETISEEVWSTSYYYITANRSPLDYCVDECLRRYRNNTKKQKECVLECITRRCNQLYPNDEQKRLQCYEHFVAHYNKKHFEKNSMTLSKTPTKKIKPRHKVPKSKSAKKKHKAHKKP
ncbi:hypothetical protein PIB30_013807 [Stylosanthes scabra]|uniref:Uncharacterized protein n=1 Tax=Stylosanthes scabra TaxID=79078 RepID=A0ABU6R6Y5_9FABA|nr:hypothetical protein [Stylosanthes scabra]